MYTDKEYFSKKILNVHTGTLEATFCHYMINLSCRDGNNKLFPISQLS